MVLHQPHEISLQSNVLDPFKQLECVHVELSIKFSSRLYIYISVQHSNEISIKIIMFSLSYLTHELSKRRNSENENFFLI